MRAILIILLNSLIISCGQPSKGQKNGSAEINESVIATIKAYYHDEYGKETRLEESVTDSLIELTYYNISSEDDEEYLIASIYIPRIKDKRFQHYGSGSVSGDLNHDGLDDLVVSVYSEGQGLASMYTALFVFINNGSGYNLSEETNIYAVCGCETESGVWQGYFSLERIENGYLIGISNCYAENDPRCCPSLTYATKVVWENDKLVFHSKEKIEAEDDLVEEEVIGQADYDESVPTSRYFRVENVQRAYYEDDGRFVLEIDVRNIYAYKFSTIYLRATTFVKLKNRDDYCKMVSQSDTDIKSRLVDWQPNEVKTLRIQTPNFGSPGNFCVFFSGSLTGFDRTPEEIYVELSMEAISIGDEPEGVFARYDLMDLWKSKQQALIEEGKL